MWYWFFMSLPKMLSIRSVMRVFIELIQASSWPRMTGSRTPPMTIDW